MSHSLAESIRAEAQLDSLKRAQEDFSSRRLNVPEAALYLGLSRSTLDRWRAARIVLPFHQIGRKVTYDTRDLDAHLESIRIEPVAI